MPRERHNKGKIKVNEKGETNNLLTPIEIIKQEYGKANKRVEANNKEFGELELSLVLFSCIYLAFGIWAATVYDHRDLKSVSL